MGGRHSRTKGLAFERLIAQKLRAVYPEARRQLEYHARDARGVDLQHTGRFRIQCKKLKTYAPVTTIQEVTYDEMLGEVPVLVTAADNCPAMAVLPFEDFLDLLLDAHRLRGPQNG